MGLEHVETIVANDDEFIDFTEVFDGSADRYRIFVDNFRPSDPSNFIYRFSSDGGSTWDSGSSDYALAAHGVLEDGSTQTASSSSSSFVQITRGGADSGHGLSTSMFHLTVHDPSDSNRATVTRHSGAVYRQPSNESLRTEMSGGQRLTQSAVDSIRFYTSTGNNISSGIFSVFKVTESAANGKQHIETIEANSQSSVDFTNVFASDDGFDRYEIHADNVIPSEISYMFSRVSSDGGSTWDNGASDYAHAAFAVQEDGGTGTQGSGGDSLLKVHDHAMGPDTTSNATCMFRTVVSNPTNPNRATAFRTSLTLYRPSAGSKLSSQYSGGAHIVQSDIDSVQFGMGSGNIDSGTFSVYGIGQ